jgi:large subunit ribosomal protein L10
LPITRARKDELIETYVKLLENSTGVVVTENGGLNMPMFDKIRSEMRKVGSTYVVTKNTLFKIALERMEMAVPEDLLSGPVVVAFAHENFPGTIKALLDLNKEAERMELKGAIAQQDVYNMDQLKELSELPTLDELRATIAGMVAQPLSQLVGLMTAPQRDIVSILQNYVTKLEEGDEGGESTGDDGEEAA